MSCSKTRASGSRPSRSSLTGKIKVLAPNTIVQVLLC
jgi:hypothetical protein